MIPIAVNLELDLLNIRTPKPTGRKPGNHSKTRLMLLEILASSETMKYVYDLKRLNTITNVKVGLN